jgi:beta-RFAP synthase
MVDRPGLRLRAEQAERFRAAGPLAGRVEAFARRWCSFHRLAALPRCALIVEHAPPEHVGLGVGTQLALSVAAALAEFALWPRPAPQELAQSVGRGLRSAVGTYGFALGGLIVERGKLPGEPISPLDVRLALPAAWRFVLVRPTHGVGLSGQPEAAAMDSLPPVPDETAHQMLTLVREGIVPGAATASFELFADSLYRYCHLAGSCYESLQWGPYNGPLLEELVGRIRSRGHGGVGQSSWGPTLFVAERDEKQARELAAWLARECPVPGLEIQIARPCNTGAVISSGDAAPHGAD